MRQAVEEYGVGIDRSILAAARSGKAVGEPVVRAMRRMVEEAERTAACDLTVQPATGYVAEVDDVEWVLDGWLPRGALSLLTGRGSAGKGRLMLQLCSAVAAGRFETLDIPLTGETALYVSAEDRPATIRRLFHRLVASGLGDAERPPDWTRQPDGSSPFLWRDDEPTPFGRAIEDIANRYDLVAIDNSALTFDGNEIDRSAVTAFLSWLDDMAADANCSVLLASHPAKTNLGEGAVYSGSSAWRNRPRALLRLRPSRKEDEHSHILVCDKQNLGARPEPIALEDDFPGWRSVGTVPARSAVSAAAKDSKATEMRERDRQIVLQREDGQPLTAIADRVGVSKSTVQRVLKKCSEVVSGHGSPIEVDHLTTDHPPTPSQAEGQGNPLPNGTGGGCNGFTLPSTIQEAEKLFDATGVLPPTADTAPAWSAYFARLQETVN